MPATAWASGFLARRTLANHRRAEIRRAEATERLRAYLLISAPQSEASDPRVEAAMQRLDPQDREILQLAYWDGLSGSDLALALEIRPDAARKRLQRARETFRRELASAAVAHR